MGALFHHMIICSFFLASTGNDLESKIKPYQSHLPIDITFSTHLNESSGQIQSMQILLSEKCSLQIEKQSILMLVGEYQFVDVREINLWIRWNEEEKPHGLDESSVEKYHQLGLQLAFILFNDEELRGTEIFVDEKFGCLTFLVKAANEEGERGVEYTLTRYRVNTH